MSKGNIGSPHSIGTAAVSSIVVELIGKCCLEGFFWLLIASRARRSCCSHTIGDGRMHGQINGSVGCTFLTSVQQRCECAVVSGIKVECILAIACALKAFVSYLDL